MFIWIASIVLFLIFVVAVACKVVMAGRQSDIELERDRQSEEQDVDAS